MEKKNFTIGKLKVKIFAARAEAGKAAALDSAERISRIIRDRGEATVVFAAAPSQNEMLANLAKSGVDWKKVRAFHMDEYVGLPADHPAGFGNFLDRAIYKAIPLKECYYLRDYGSGEAAAEYSKLLEKYPPDLVLLGIGENGHLAFNDPAFADFNDPAAVKLVELDDICRMQQVNDGCFASFDEVPKTAITLTMSALCHIPEKVTLAPGPAKAEAVLHALTGPVTAACPASILRSCDNTVLYLDADSAAKIDSLF
jgi:glucosamine-6-phosphate deaminase